MNLTDYHAKCFAYELTRRFPSDSVEKFAAALADAQVDLNPHQVDAALFAFRSPLSKGALLADEVGLGNLLRFSRPSRGLALGAGRLARAASRFDAAWRRFRLADQQICGDVERVAQRPDRCDRERPPARQHLGNAIPAAEDWRATQRRFAR